MSDCTNCGEYSGHPCDEREILTDLIAELRGHEYVSGDYLTDLANEYQARLEATQPTRPANPNNTSARVALWRANGL